MIFLPVDFEIKFSLLKPWNPANQILEWKNGIFDFEADWEELTTQNCVQTMIYNINNQRFEECCQFIRKSKSANMALNNTVEVKFRFQVELGGPLEAGPPRQHFSQSSIKHG